MEQINQMINDSSLTQRQIAKEIGFTEQHFCTHIKNNYGSLSISKVIKLADLLGIGRNRMCNIIINNINQNK